MPVGRRVVRIKSELADTSVEFAGVVGKPVGDGVGFLDHRGVLLREAVHFIDGGTDFANADQLFLGGGGDVPDGRVDVRHMAGYLMEHIPRSFDQRYAIGHLITGLGDQTLDISRGRSGALGKLAHLLSDHRKTLAGIACTGGLYPCVERQKVRLERISSITLIMLLISREAFSICAIASTALVTTPLDLSVSDLAS